ncbi:MAG: cell division protein, partial [Selenomonas sp.]|nr:cell division protein [Selenomonas sp.]
FDRSHMKRNADGSISYWQLILYNNLGRAQFAEAMKNADYENLGYTMQRRVLSPKKDAISTYEILAYDGDNALITESSREGHRAVIRANTMTEKERDAVRQELRRKK